MIYGLFIFLSILMAIEASTSVARQGGYAVSNAASGLMLQSSLGLLSRVVMFMFMPLLGMAADSGSVFDENIELILSFLLIPGSLCLVYSFKGYVYVIYLELINRMSINGSYFRPSGINKDKYAIRTGKFSQKFKVLYIVTYVAYIPYYMAWPTVIFLLSKYPENRGLILGLSSVFNGINTILLTMLIDPKLVQLGKYRRVIVSIYSDLILIRLLSCLTVFMFILTAIIIGV